MWKAHICYSSTRGLKAQTLLSQHGAQSDQADAVCEAIIRRAELGDTGMTTSLGLLIQLMTVFSDMIQFL